MLDYIMEFKQSELIKIKKTVHKERIKRNGDIEVITENLNVNMNDILILHYIYHALCSDKLQTIYEDNKIYVWLNHKHLLENIPILDISQNRLSTILSKLKTLELIDIKNYANNNGKGSRCYIAFTTILLECLTDKPKDHFVKIQSDKRPLCENTKSNNKTTFNNKINNNSLNKFKELEQFETKNNFLGSAKKVKVSETKKDKKENLYINCINLINDFTDDAILKEYLVEFLKMLLENSRETGYPVYTNSFKGKLRKLKELSDNVYTQRKIVLKTLDNVWNGFYPLKDVKKTKNVARDIEQLDGYVMKQGNKNKLRRAIEDGTTEQF